MTKLDLRWRMKENRKWLTRNHNGTLVPANDAPDHVKRSYRHYQQQIKNIMAREKEQGAQIL